MFPAHSQSTTDKGVRLALRPLSWRPSHFFHFLYSGGLCITGGCAAAILIVRDLEGGKFCSMPQPTLTGKRGYHASCSKPLVHSAGDILWGPVAARLAPASASQNPECLDGVSVYSMCLGLPPRSPIHAGRSPHTSIQPVSGLVCSWPVTCGPYSLEKGGSRGCCGWPLSFP